MLPKEKKTKKTNNKQTNPDKKPTGNIITFSLYITCAYVPLNNNLKNLVTPSLPLKVGHDTVLVRKIESQWYLQFFMARHDYISHDVKLYWETPTETG